MIELTQASLYERHADGRPRVPTELLIKLQALTAEDVWEVLHSAGYLNQFEGDWTIIHPETRLIGRAVTAQFMPLRPDMKDILHRTLNGSTYIDRPNQQIIDMLKSGDVVVVDLFGKREGGTFVGDLLAGAICATTGTGMVVNGAIRDLEGVSQYKMTSYIRAVHPTPLHQVMLTGINVPIRIGRATVLPGDVVFGDREGLYFIPPMLVQKTIETAAQNRVKEEWIKLQFQSGRHLSRDVYPSPRTPALIEDFERFRRCKQMGSVSQNLPDSNKVDE